MKTPVVHIRPIKRDEVNELLNLVRELADFEQLGHEVTATELGLRQAFFSMSPSAGAFMAWKGSQAVGFAVYYKTFSTFVGKPGVFLEDLYIKPEYRGMGLGRKLLLKVADVAKEINAGRFEWWTLQWNHQAIKFYEKLGADVRSDWRLLRMLPDKYKTLTDEAPLCSQTAGVTA